MPKLPTAEVLSGDCRKVLYREFEDNYFDTCITDPPYHLTSIVKRFGKEGSAPVRGNEAYARAAKGFMGKAWDGGDVAFQPETWKEVLRVLRPGAHLVAFGGTRTFHRLACAIEDAGFEIRDTLAWMYGSGFPKSQNVSLQIDKQAGFERTEITGVKPGHYGKQGPPHSLRGNGVLAEGFSRPWMEDPEAVKRYHTTLAPVTEQAVEWEGWGTALKPAFEPIVLARKPLSEKTVAANVLRWRTGALNIDGCRIGQGEERKTLTGGMGRKANPVYGRFAQGETEALITSKGRWPANVMHDGSDEVIGAFPSSSARFFYCAKASVDERAGSKHPTVKPIALMRWLCRLVSPSGGLILDPFAGSGSTIEAALYEKLSAIAVEMDGEYVVDIERRIARAAKRRYHLPMDQSSSPSLGIKRTGFFRGD